MELSPSRSSGRRGKKKVDYRALDDGTDSFFMLDEDANSDPYLYAKQKSNPYFVLDDEVKFKLPGLKKESNTADANSGTEDAGADTSVASNESPLKEKKTDGSDEKGGSSTETEDQDKGRQLVI